MKYTVKDYKQLKCYSITLKILGETVTFLLKTILLANKKMFFQLDTNGFTQ